MLIVGGGPAGLATAIVCARAGLRTLLCEKKRFPVDKPCGEGLMPSGWAVLTQLGAAQRLGPDVSSPLVGIRYFSPSGHVAAAAFAEGTGRGIQRIALSAALWRTARTEPDLSLVEGVTVRPKRRAPEGVYADVGGEKVCARLLVGADGRMSRVRRWAGLDGEAGRWRRWGARRHFCLAPWSNHVEVRYSRQGVEAYITPAGEREINVAFLWHREHYPGLRGGAGLFPSLLKLFPDLQERLAGAPPSGEVAATGPLHQRARGVIGEGVLLIGDAAGYLDAITGEGLSLAFESAFALERTVVPHLRAGEGILGRGALAHYAEEHRTLVAPYYRITGLVLLLSRFPALADRAIQVLAREPAAFQQLLSANMGHASLWSPPLFARLGRGALLQSLSKVGRPRSGIGRPA